MSWPERSKPPKIFSWSGQDPQWNVETHSTRRIRLSPCSVQQNMPVRILSWKIVRVHNNTNIKTQERSNKPFKLSSNGSNKCSVQSNGENDIYKTVGLLWPEGNTVDTTMWKQNRTNNYRPSFVSGSHREEDQSKQWAGRFHLLWYGESIWFNMETRHPDGHTRSHNRRMHVQFYTKLPQTQIFKFKVNDVLSDIKVQTEDIHQGSVVNHTFFILKINIILA